MSIPPSPASAAKKPSSGDQVESGKTIMVMIMVLVMVLVMPMIIVLIMMVVAVVTTV